MQILTTFNAQYTFMDYCHRGVPTKGAVDGGYFLSEGVWIGFSIHGADLFQEEFEEEQQAKEFANKVN